jgi:hypothetical protein
MNKFTAATSNLAALINLVARAEALFGNAEGVIGVHTYTHSTTVTVQMKEADLLEWCMARGRTPDATVTETDYRPFGGGFMTHRRMEVVVVEVESGRLVLTSSEVVGTRPATEAGATEAVA